MFYNLVVLGEGSFFFCLNFISYGIDSAKNFQVSAMMASVLGVSDRC